MGRYVKEQLIRKLPDLSGLFECWYCGEKNQKKQYYIDNKDEILKYHKTYYEENKEEIAERYKKYCEEHPHILANNHARRHARTENQEITKTEWLLVMEECGWRCFYCDIKLDKQNRSVDHFIPLAKGGRHSIEILVAACRSCNSSKKDKYYHQWKINC